MKRIVLVSVALLSGIALAIVGPGKAQTIAVVRDATEAIQFMVDDGKGFPDVDSCAEHCWNRSGSVTKDSQWSNLVNIEIRCALSEEDRQYIGDRFVAHYVYPYHISWTSDGKTNTVEYSPDKKSFREKRELK